MFYNLIQRKRDIWYASSDCTVRDIILYIEQTGFMRDAQTEAIKTYLFLKIACQNKPLWQLFYEGYFCSLDADELNVNIKTRELFLQKPALLSLYEYATLKDRNRKQISKELEEYILHDGEHLDCEKIFKDIFYNVNYTDYIFSLPMGAGKTFLMAAFIYLDLYFATNNPEDATFAHNFLILAPSGLKSSIIPSLKTIQNFSPEWIIPEPSANNLKKLIHFEILNENKSASKSNRTKNPNAQKINSHQPLDSLMGLVAVTNAEKVILDRLDKEENIELFSKEEQDKIRYANELRYILGKLPNLSVLIDEVHHAADSEIKLRQVVNTWGESHKFNSVLGFSGTPYLEKAENVMLGEKFSIKHTFLSNVVYNYPLIEGIGNFLKIPSVYFTDNNTSEIVTQGVKAFLRKYKNKQYSNGTLAKLAVYCGQIETLEEEIYPLVSKILLSEGMNPATDILKYHGGNKKYAVPEGSQREFLSLDTDVSKIRIILLVQIGKEGWDCRSLTSVILPHENACPKNMVLQTSCRCLRQVDKNEEETALIWMNKRNADFLNKQLQTTQNISLAMFNNKQLAEKKTIERFSRMEKLKVPDIDFYQLKISYNTVILEEHPQTAKLLQSEDLLQKQTANLVYEQDFNSKTISITESKSGDTDKESVSFFSWLCLTEKESFSTLGLSDLLQYKDELQNIFNKITLKENSLTYLNPLYNHYEIRSLIRKAFAVKRDFVTNEEILPEKASLLQIEKLISPLYVSEDKNFYPDQRDVKEIMQDDEKADRPELSEEQKRLIEQLKATGLHYEEYKEKHGERKQTYHYLPYRFDSDLEIDYFANSIIPLIKGKNLEVYFNGDDALTDFKINCYEHHNNSWYYMGKYVPDFLLLQRSEDGQINKVVIIETKGGIYAEKFSKKREFMKEFIKRNNEKFGYSRFDFLYLEDTLKKEERETKTLSVINEFFN